MKTGNLPIRALNEYRRVSPFTYIALRHALDATAAQSNRWVEEIAPALVAGERLPSQFHTHQFKSRSSKGVMQFRDMVFPSCNEAMAEVALLAKCAEYTEHFSPAAEVYSYHLLPPSSREGVFRPYFETYAERQAAIGKACERWPKDTVLYLDIRQFYPSIGVRRAMAVWKRTCTEAELPEKWKNLGVLLLNRQYSKQKPKQGKKGLCVGPMLSHVIGNLVLAEVDKAMRSRFPGRYFRYVDDMALVIPERRVDQAIERVCNALKSLRLKLNKGKELRLSAGFWRENAPYQNDYGPDDDRSDVPWMEFVDRSKLYLLCHPENTRYLRDSLTGAEFRVPLPRYQLETKSSGYRARFAARIASKQIQKKVQGLSVEGIVRNAKHIRQVYCSGLSEIWNRYTVATGMEKRWYLSRLRFLLSKVLLTADSSFLGQLEQDLSGHPELAHYREIVRAILTRDVSGLVEYGGKVCAGAGQALAMLEGGYRCKRKRWGIKAVHGYAVLLLSGVRIDTEIPDRVRECPEVRFAAGNFDRRTWVEMKDGFFRDLMGLAGARSYRPQSEVLYGPLDPDERWVVMADELAEISG